MIKPLTVSTKTTYLVVALIVATPSMAKTSVTMATDSSATVVSAPVATDLIDQTEEIVQHDPLSNHGSPVDIEPGSQLADQLGYQDSQQGELLDPKADLKPANSEQHWTDETREEIQDRLHIWANQMDGWFGEPNSDKPATASLRVILDTRWVDDPVAGSNVTVEPRIRGRLRLPVLERRLSLIIGDTDLDNETVLRRDSTGKTYHTQTSEQDKLIDRKKVREDNASIALRWSRFSESFDSELGVETDIDVGIRSIDNPFIKISVDKDWYEDEQLKVSSDTFYRYGLESKHYARGGLELQLGRHADRFVNNRTAIHYRHQDDDERTTWNNDLRQIHHFGNQRQLSYGISAAGDFSQDKSLLNSYGPAVSYRQPVWRDWLYMQTELNYYNDKAEHKEHYPSALLRMEALF